MDFELFLIIIEYIGTIAFAISGALIAIENKMDILGAVILGSTTAVGGGLFRDIILGSTPSMFTNPNYVVVAVVTSLIVFVVMYFLKNI